MVLKRWMSHSTQPLHHNPCCRWPGYAGKVHVQWSTKGMKCLLWPLEHWPHPSPALWARMWHECLQELPQSKAKRQWGSAGSISSYRGLLVGDLLPWIHQISTTFYSNSNRTHSLCPCVEEFGDAALLQETEHFILCHISKSWSSKLHSRLPSGL